MGALSRVEKRLNKIETSISEVKAMINDLRQMHEGTPVDLSSSILQLSKPQQEVLVSVNTYIETTGVNPSASDISRVIGKHRCSVSVSLNQLVALGYLSKLRTGKRVNFGLKVVK